MLRGMPDGTIYPAQQAAARLCFRSCRIVRFIRHNNRRRVRASGHAGWYDSSGTTSSGAFALRLCRAVRFNQHNKQPRVCASRHVGRYDSSITTTGGAFVILGMPGSTIHPAQQPAARLCFGACQAVRFIQHNNRRRVRASGYAGKYDSSDTTSGGATDRTDPSRRLPVALHITYSIIKKPHEHLRTARALCAAL